MFLSTPALIAIGIIVLGILIFLVTYYRKKNQRDLEKIEAELKADDSNLRR